MTMASDDHPSARSAGSRRLAFAVSAFAFSLVVAVVVPFLFIRLIANAQGACFNIAGGQAFFLMVTWFGLVIAGWWLFWVGALIAWRMRPVVRMVVGVLFVLGLCLFATWQLVPWEPMSGHATVGAGTCGPGGVPTWWPPFLPHR